MMSTAAVMCTTPILRQRKGRRSKKDIGGADVDGIDTVECAEEVWDEGGEQVRRAVSQSGS